MANSADPDQLASSEANWSGSTLFAKAGYIQIQQDKGYNKTLFYANLAISKQFFSWLLEGSAFVAVCTVCI